MASHPTGGLREISTLSINTRPSGDPDAGAYSPLTPGGKNPNSTRAPRTLFARATRPVPASSSSYSSSSFFSSSSWRPDPKKTSPRIRLFARIVSLIASGTTFASLTDVIFNYAKTKNITMHHEKVWPSDTDILPTVAVLIASLACFLVDLAWFGCSARERVRTLGSPALKWWCAGLAGLMVSGQIGAIVYADMAQTKKDDGMHRGLGWVCDAKETSWDETEGGNVDFAFWCGEVDAAGISRWGVVGAQGLILCTVGWEVVGWQRRGARKAAAGLRPVGGVSWWDEVRHAPVVWWAALVGLFAGKWGGKKGGKKGIYSEVKGGIV